MGGQPVPTPDDVSLISRTRTVGTRVGGLGGGLGGDATTGDVVKFSDDTRPSTSEVELLIDAAKTTIQAMLPPYDPAQGDGDSNYGSRVKEAIRYQTAILIEGSFFRQQLDSSSVELWQSLITAIIAPLRTELVNLQPGGGGASGGTGRGFGTLAVGTMFPPSRRVSEDVGALGDGL